MYNMYMYTCIHVYNCTHTYMYIYMCKLHMHTCIHTVEDKKVFRFCSVGRLQFAFAICVLQLPLIKKRMVEVWCENGKKTSCIVSRSRNAYCSHGQVVIAYMLVYIILVIER